MDNNGLKRKVLYYKILENISLLVLLFMATSLMWTYASGEINKEIHQTFSSFLYVNIFIYIFIAYSGRKKQKEYIGKYKKNDIFYIKSGSKLHKVSTHFSVFGWIYYMIILTVVYFNEAYFMNKNILSLMIVLILFICLTGIYGIRILLKNIEC